MPGALPGKDKLALAEHMVSGDYDADKGLKTIDEHLPRQVPRWSPYQDNGGTCLALSGKGFVVMCADTRMSNFYDITSRTTRKISQLCDTVMIASGGMMADRAALHKNIRHRLQLYEYRNNKKPDVNAVQQVLSTMLYHRRFFPIYAYNLLGGLDEEGDGVVYSYDVVGCVEALRHAVVGGGQPMIEPYLDMRLTRSNQWGADGKPIGPWYDTITKEEAIELAQDAMHSAAERDITTGDDGDIFILTKDGVEIRTFRMRKD
eukprot:TRINITY_DN60453_c0_g1_i1.p2 TRINITY_DN60453_c0_g1~~TRINITY_DN60453_c0_g1_i1.p2  ORF type:complete len:290 (+),score=125.32 TRINITY_DN60453_c0_g1_i1:88-870(+)